MKKVILSIYNMPILSTILYNKDSIHFLDSTINYIPFSLLSYFRDNMLTFYLLHKIFKIYKK